MSQIELLSVFMKKKKNRTCNNSNLFTKTNFQKYEIKKVG